MSGFRDMKHQIGWLGKLDALLHAIKIPHRVMRPICDAYERKLAAGSSCITTNPCIKIYDDTGTSTSSSSTNLRWTFELLGTGGSDNRDGK